MWVSVMSNSPYKFRIRAIRLSLTIGAAILIFAAIFIFMVRSEHLQLSAHSNNHPSTPMDVSDSATAFATPASGELAATLSGIIDELHAAGDLRGLLDALDIAITAAEGLPTPEARTLLLNTQWAVYGLREEAVEAAEDPEDFLRSYIEALDRIAQANADLFLRDSALQQRDPEGFGMAMIHSATQAFTNNDPDRALLIYAQIVNDYANILDQETVQQALQGMASIAARQGNQELSEELYDRAIANTHPKVQSYAHLQQIRSAALIPSQRRPSERAANILATLWADPFVQASNPAAVHVGESFAYALLQTDEPETALHVYVQTLDRLDRFTPDDLQVYRNDLSQDTRNLQLTLLHQIYRISYDLGDYGLAYETALRHSESYDFEEGQEMAQRALRALNR